MSTKQSEKESLLITLKHYLTEFVKPILLINKILLNWLKQILSINERLLSWTLKIGLNYR